MKNILKEATLDDLQGVFNEAIEEIKASFEGAVKVAYEAGRTSVDEAKLEKFKVGDEVEYIGGDNRYYHLTPGRTYEILDRTKHVHEKIPVFRIEDDRKRVDEGSLIRADTAHLFKVVEEVVPKSLNQQRAELIQQSKRFLVQQKNKHGYYVSPGLSPKLCDAKFFINKKNRTVQVQLKGIASETLYSMGIAECMPNKVFNVDILKAIALADALKVDVPANFTSAIQPDEVVKGMIVQTYMNHKPFMMVNVAKVTGGNRIYEDLVTENYVRYEPHRHGDRIIDDTNAEYGYEA